ncbi:MAG: LEA type 2 family protein [Candidatus Aminicenantes bacterium]|nr:LEA type 2 family protein [Candidatus Aminicenantes bacterium]
MRRDSLCFLSIMLIAGTWSSAALKDDVKVTLVEKQIQNLQADGLTLALYLKIENLSSRPCFFSGYSYRFVVLERDFIQYPLSTLTDGIKIESRSSTTISLPVKITYSYLFKEVPGTADLDSVSCYLMGRLHFSDGRRDWGYVPVAYTADFPIYKEPEVRFLPLEIKAMTLAGADVLFRFKLINSNGFDLPVERLDYELYFGGHSVGTGRIDGDKGLKAKSEKEFSIPLLLNFAEMERGIQGLLQTDRLNCKLTGELEIRPSWQRMILPLNVRETVSIRK